MLRFALRFVLIAGVLFGLYCFPYAEQGIAEAGFERYLAAYARVTGWLLHFFEPGIVVAGRQIQGQFSLEIIKNCDAMENNILFLAAVLALPSPWKQRALACLVGLPVLILANLLRLVSLYLVGRFAPASFEFCHIELWPLLLVLLTVSAFVFVARRAQQSAVAT
jgi:exosortase/archaeosortase family protein